MSLEQFFLLIRPLLNFLRDLVFIILYVKTIDSDYLLSKRKKLAPPILLLSGITLLFGTSADSLGTILLPLPNLPEAIVTLIRFLIRAVCCFCYIRLLKKISLPTTVYDALLICTVCQINHNLFLTPITRPILNAAVELFSRPLVNSLACLLIINAASILIYYIVYRFVPLRDVKNVRYPRIVLLLVLALLSQYLNSSLKIIEYADAVQKTQFSIYTILLQLLLLVCIIYIERYQNTIREYLRTKLENQATQSLLEHIEKQRENDNLIRQLRHDTRNHLISLRHLISSQNYNAAIEYLNALSSEYTVAQPRIKTGNLILDGILVQKMDIAEKNSVAFSVSADFSPLSPMNNSDICILFGNLLDNALEACLKVAPEFRSINIRGRLMGECVIYTIENSCTELVLFSGDLPRTTKHEKNDHGIGLISVSRIIKKYNGTIAFSGGEKRFSVICSFPLPIQGCTEHPKSKTKLSPG